MGFTLTRRLILGLYAVVIAVPLTVVLFGTFKTTEQLFTSPFGLPSSASLDNYATVLGEQNLDRALYNSVAVTVASVVTTLFLASLAAYAVARIPGWRGNLMFGFLVLGLTVPAQANMIPQYVLFDRLGLLDSLFGLVLINVVARLPVAVLILGGFMKALPKEFYEASSIDGAGPWRPYRSIALPLSRPAMATTAIFLFVLDWNELLYPLLFIQSAENRTLPLALLSFQGEFLTNYPLLFTGVVIATLPVLVTYLLMQRYFVAGITAGAVKG